MWWRKEKKCDCGYEGCKTFVEVMPNGRMIRHNITTCGKFIKQLEQLKKMKL